MSGAIKSVKKVFKKVAKFIKKIIKPVLIAAAVYFTAGLALAAFPATAGFAAALPGFAGGGILGTGIGAGAVAGTGLFSKAAAAIGLGSLGSSGGLIGGALAKGTSLATLAGSGIKGTALLAGATKAAGAGLISGLPSGLATALAAGTPGAGLFGTISVGGGITGPGMNVVGATTKMSLGEKLLLASTGVQALGAFMAPTEAEKKKFVGAFYGTDSRGGGGPVVPTLEAQTTPTAPIAPAQQTAAKNERPLVDPSGGIQPGPGGIQPTAPAAPRPGGDLFAQSQQAQPSSQPLGIPDLFRRMPGVRYLEEAA